MRRRLSKLGLFGTAFSTVFTGAVVTRAAEPSFTLSPASFAQSEKSPDLENPRQEAEKGQIDLPKFMLLPQDTESVYAPPDPPREDQGVNNGGVNFELATRYLTDYVYRGISHNRASGGNIHSANFQIDTQIDFNLGKLPHPYVGVFSNINDADPISRFQEIRPFFGLEYTLRPLIFNLGHNTYIYPERERLNPSPNTSEVFLKITLDDSYFFLTPHPILSPYIYAAYDYQSNLGWYLEAGVRHDFIFEDLGFTLTTLADVAYVSNYARQFVTFSSHYSGFQHYDVGIVGTYSLSNLLQIPPRYGQFSLQGYLTYTSKFSNEILANTEIWGGVGLMFKY